MKNTTAENRQNIFFACSFHGNSMNNNMSCGLVDARISASEKDLPVLHAYIICFNCTLILYYYSLVWTNVVARLSI